MVGEGHAPVVGNTSCADVQNSKGGPGKAAPESQRQRWEVANGSDGPHCDPENVRFAGKSLLSSLIAPLGSQREVLRLNRRFLRGRGGVRGGPFATPGVRRPVVRRGACRPLWSPSRALNQRRITSCCDPKGPIGDLHDLSPINRALLKGRTGVVGLPFVELRTSRISEIV